MSSRVFVSVTAKLQCGSPVQAIEPPRSPFASRGSPSTPSAATTPLDAAPERDAREHEVLLAGDPHVAAERSSELGEARAAAPPRQADVHRHADAGPAVVLGLDAEVVGRLAVEGGSGKSGERAPEAALDLARMPSGPRSSTMNLSRALTRETR